MAEAECPRDTGEKGLEKLIVVLPIEEAATAGNERCVLHKAREMERKLHEPACAKMINPDLCRGYSFV